tara:strand:- start:35692 stop:36657 length:966 start_codon:yes stop_codon:yes gene_type:complete
MSDKKEIRTGVIGVGSMGQNHARVYSEISNLVGISDPDENQGKMIADRFGIKYFKNIEDLLKEVDAVSIAAPTIYHEQISKSCCDAGVHILVEKPLSNNFPDAKKIKDYVENAGLILAVGHIERFNPVISYAKREIESGNWGRIITMSSKRVSKFPGRIRDVGVVFDLAIHDLDILSYLASSSFESIYSVGGKIEYPDKEDHVSVIINYKNGINAICEVNWLTPMKIRQLTLTCTKAYVVLDYTEQKIKIFKSKIGTPDLGNLWDLTSEISEDTITLEKREPLKLELEDFLNAIVTKSNPLVGADSGIRAVEMAELITGQL